jgi:hypothetical protein
MQGTGEHSGADLQPRILPVSNRKKSSTPALHAKGPAEKRAREDTPSPQKQQESTGIDWHGRINADVTWAKGKIGTAALALKSDKIVSLADSVRDFFNKTLVDIIERQANTSSDLATEVIRLQRANEQLQVKVVSQDEDISNVKLCKDKTEVKVSKKEMEERIKVASTQVKISDISFGKEITDYKALQSAAKEVMAEKVRSDLRKDYDERIKGAALKVLSSKTFKATVDGKEIWTAPLLVTIPDRENRWAFENCLRSSKIFPGFHWPREMVDNIKVFRQTVRNLGYKEQTHLIRIRPEERDGAWRIRADAKPKNSNERFTSVATFDIPPLDDSLKKHVPGWATPVWVRKQAGGQAAQVAAGPAGGNAQQETMTIDFSEDVDVDNL